VAVDIRTFNGD